ncbi:MAG: fumarylacetoacetate hydrolase family protein [Vampirovibrionales bacterium]|nr:fumarylacetoacetate hydrolase family protein [Vampirovibrionales bacterium]
MKLVSFEVTTVLGRFVRAGVVLESAEQNRILDLNAAYAWQLAEEGEAKAKTLANAILPSQMLGIIETGERSLDAALGLLEQFNSYAQAAGKRTDFPLGLNEARLVFEISEVVLKAPFQPASFRDFFAFEQHVATGYRLRNESIPDTWYKIPVYYKGNHRSIIGPEDTLTWPSYTQKLDYELELGCIIGKSGRDLTPEQAKRHIFGYTLVNDFSARDIQKHEMQCRLGPAKAKDFATAIGPCIVTRDELPDITSMRLQGHINGQLLSQGNMADCHFSFEEMISHWSQGETIYAGDLIASGTVGTGCGLEHGTWLAPGDEITLSADGIGELRNRIAEPKAQMNLLDAFPGKSSKLSPTT